MTRSILVQFGCLGIVLRNTCTTVVHITKVFLRLGIAVFSGTAIPLGRFCKISTNFGMPVVFPTIYIAQVCLRFSITLFSCRTVPLD